LSKYITWGESHEKLCVIGWCCFILWDSAMWEIGEV